MPKVEIEYTEEAIADLKDIFHYIAEESILNALNYIDYVEDAIEKLEDNPELGMKCNRKRVRIECRVLIVKSHLVVYKYNFSRVKILRVVRDKQKYTDFLN
jgi:plasmid stabilization system protein ParE